MRVLNIEDNIYKHMEIKRALEWCGIMDVDLVENSEVLGTVWYNESRDLKYDLKEIISRM